LPLLKLRFTSSNNTLFPNDRVTLFTVIILCSKIEAQRYEKTGFWRV
jgi:hypothetical protein